MASNPPKPRSAVDAANSTLDSRYAALLEELAGNLTATLNGLTTPLIEDQHAEFEARWGDVVLPALIKQLDALVGPAQPVIAEACEAYHHIRDMDTSEEGYNTCKGETVAVVRRFGRPESPGSIYRHHPGCQKHAMKAMSSLSKEELRYGGSYPGPRMFFSVIPLEEARREIRQQELLASSLPARRRWFRRR